MKAHTRAVIGPGGVLSALACEPPLTLRRVRSDDPGTCALCLVGTAAGPLPGDVLDLDITVTAKARATLRATGASLAQGHGGPPSLLTIRVEVGPNAHLDADLAPLIVAAGADVQVALELSLAPTASLVWRETIVLGRTGEQGGRARVRWDITRGTRPLLRQSIELGRSTLSADPAGGLTGRRVLQTALLVGGPPARTVVHSPTAVAQVLADGSALVTALSDDTAGRDFERLLAAVQADATAG